jgi:hypothetical protein
MLKKIFRWLLFGLACLITLVALVLAEENWRGKHAWGQYKRMLEAKGEPLTLAALAPPLVPDDQNFAMTPLLKPLFPQGTNYATQLRKRLTLPAAAERKEEPRYGDWATARTIDLKEWQEYLGGTNILEVLHKLDPELDEIAAASRRPYARFSVRYEDGFMMLLPHLTALRQLARLYVLRACAELEQGQTDRAAADVATILRLADSIRDDPLLISQLVRIAIVQIGVQPIWEGLHRHQWSDSQLAVFQNELQRMDFVSGGLRSLRSERACFNDALEAGIAGPRGLSMLWKAVDPNSSAAPFPLSLMLRGWLYQNLLSANRYYQEYLFPAVDAAVRRISPRKLASAEQWLQERKAHYVAYPYNIFTLMFVPALSKACMQFARAQTTVDEAIIACALERYRLAHGQFPDSLDALVPPFINKLPNDVISGQPLKYRRTGDGGFVLYSVGWNETDDGGEVALTKSKPPQQDRMRGDWVWQSQPSASERK